MQEFIDAQVGIFAAAAKGQTDELRSLLEKDPSLINAHSAEGFTPLGLAAFFGHPETVLALLEAGADVKITVISMGKESAQAAIKQVLAMGADEGLLLDDDAFQGGDWNNTVNVLSTAIQKLGDVDAVFCGRQAAVPLSANRCADPGSGLVIEVGAPAFASSFACAAFIGPSNSQRRT